MKKLTKPVDYISPEIDCIGLMPVSVLCQSGEGGPSFGTTLEDMTENDYTFTF